MFFLPWPFHISQLWTNEMHIDVKFGTDAIVKINPNEGSFYVNGVATSGFISVLEKIPFENVSINHINERVLPGEWNNLKDAKLLNVTLQPQQYALDGLSRNFLRRLVLINTSVNSFRKGKLFEGFVNLEELRYEGEAIKANQSGRTGFELIYFPRRLKRVELSYVKVLPPPGNWEGAMTSLEYLGFGESQFYPGFPEMLLKYFTVTRLSFIYCEVGHRPNFDWLETFSKMGQLEKLVLCNFDTSCTAQIQEFVDATIIPVFNRCKIPTACSDLEFSRNFNPLPGDKFPYNVAKLAPNVDHYQIKDVFNPDFASDPPAVDFIYLAPSQSVPGYEVGDTKLKRETSDQYYFDGDEANQGKPVHEHVRFPSPARLLDKKVKEIVIKNSTLGNIALQFLGCKRLEFLILENVVWTAATQIKTDLPCLKSYSYFETRAGPSIINRLTEEKLKDILFFCKNGYKNLYSRRLDIVVSLNSEMNFIVNNAMGEVTLQNVEGADQLLTELTPT